MKMLKQEWKQLLAKPLLLGTMIVMMFIPIIYGGFFLGSSWDPYGKTDRLPVAVVNEDVASEYEGQMFAVGAELEENLKKNETLDWHFTDANQAERGMSDGKYFMVLTIPEDFSANAASVMDDQPKPMNLHYETNPGRGFFIEAVSKQATMTIKEEVAENVTKEYVKAIFAQVESVGEGLQEAAQGAEQLDTGTRQAQDGNTKLTAGLGELSEGSLTFQEGAEQLEVGVEQFAGGASDLNQGASQLNKGIFEYTEGVGELQNGVAGLAAGTAELNDNGAVLVQGSVDLAEGIGSLVPGAERLSAGLTETERGSAQLNNGLLELQAQTSKLTDSSSGIQQLASGQAALGEGLAELSAGSAALQSGLNSLNNELPAADQIEALKQGLTGIQDSISKLNEAVSATGGVQDASSLQANLNATQQSLEELQTASASTAVEALQAAPAYGSLTEEQQTELSAAVSRSVEQQATVQQAALETLQGNLAAVSANLNEKIIPEFQSLGSLPENITELNNAVAQVNPQAGQALDGYSMVRNALEGQLIPGAASLNSGAEEAVQGSKTLLAGTEKAAENLPQLAEAVDRLAQGSSALNEGMSSLATGSHGLAEGASALQQGSLELEQGAASYTAGVSKAAEGAGALQQGANQLVANSEKLNSGAAELAGGTNRLVEGIPALSRGTVQLAGGAAELHKGSNELASGSGELENGIGQLTKGSAELAANLADGAEEVNGAQIADANVEMIAAPATTTESQRSKVPNYGHALAPYILSLGLFVGALSFNLVFPINAPAGRPTSGTAWWLSKFSLGFVQATSAALIVDAIMLFGFHLQVEHIGEFIAVSIITSLTYMFLIMFLGITFGNPGRFAAMILLVLQLGASGGMFPVELTNGFFQKVHDFVPMSYALLGFRESMSSAYGTETFIMSISVLGAFFILFNGLLWGVLSIRSRKAFRLAEEN
ncbi:YhgE/Pip domain-containing protein [Planococcus sp. CPCC 101016]|uniref:YhgE/Pip domain-containing protein n=1 Tax=Planococcus sp. CPCC 101016 TaxID=2599617 RepID=UPI0011B5DB59|nr:YhgE/Pip domain-containing protein [Planococcus sp. CPCC 101016]TWT08021.1 YhgE/Pip domain-containing protein [Planococcus sp. CPCC 101016]